MPRTEARTALGLFAPLVAWSLVACSREGGGESASLSDAGQDAALESVDASVIDAADPGLDGGVPVVAPTLDIDGLHADWSTHYLDGGAGCVWPRVTIDDVSGDAGAAALQAALTATSSDAGVICGPTIHIAAGRYQGPALVITRPTIVTGGEIAATVASAAGQPIWLQDVAIVGAPYPGGLFVSHPSSETTLVRVSIRDSAGAGLIHNGGFLSMWDSEVRGGTIPATPLSDPRTDPVLVRTGFGQPSAVAQAAFPYSISLRLPYVVTESRTLLGKEVDGYLNAATSKPHDFQGLDILSSFKCIGASAYFANGTVVELGNVTFANAPTAGMFAEGVVIVGDKVSSVGNGYQKQNVASLNTLIASEACVGAFTGKHGALLLVDRLSVLANSPVGLFLDGSYGSMGYFMGLGTTPWLGDGWGDNVTVSGGSLLSLDQFSSRKAARVGLFFINATGNLFSGDSSSNAIGLYRDTSQVYLAPGKVTIEGNLQRNVQVGGATLPIPNQPLPIPPHP